MGVYLAAVRLEWHFSGVSLSAGGGRTFLSLGLNAIWLSMTARGLVCGGGAPFGLKGSEERSAPLAWTRCWLIS